VQSAAFNSVCIVFNPAQFVSWSFAQLVIFLMGNDFGSNMGVACMASTTPNINRSTVQMMLKMMKEVPMNVASPFTVANVDFFRIVNSIEFYDDSDLEILNALFHLFDTKGNATVLYREYLAGVTACLIAEPLQAVLVLAFEVYDIKGSNDLSRADLRKILHAINHTASYFGDRVLQDSDVEDIVVDLFHLVSSSNSTDHTEVDRVPACQCAELLLVNDLVLSFLNGQGTKQFER
jgi:Ca2+-binding EF-hand superfamily protein